MLVILGALCLLQASTAQLITFRDGKVGVNFAGYHADAGLGGLLTGNSAHGGLSASAGTPWGPRAAAGLGGDLDGRASGVGYAAAEANPQVGASALLHGTAGGYSYMGAEAHSPGHLSLSATHHLSHPATSAPDASHVQKVKPPKKYSLIKQEVPTKKDAKVVHTHSYTKSVQRPHPHVISPQGSPVGLALDIPIGILRSLQQSLGALASGQAPAPASAQPVPAHSR